MILNSQLLNPEKPMATTKTDTKPTRRQRLIARLTEGLKGESTVDLVDFLYGGRDCLLDACIESLDDMDDETLADFADDDDNSDDESAEQEGGAS